MFDPPRNPQSSATNPLNLARQSSRTILRKRFYDRVEVSETVDGFVVSLDGRPIRTPSKRPLALPGQILAEVVAEEWRAQGADIDPLTMPMTRLANSTIDAVADRVAEVVDDIAKYLESDLLCYRAPEPEALVARQAELWDPVLFWATENFGAHFILAEGVMHVAQPPRAVALCRVALPSDAWRAAAAHVVTTISGSALLTLALIHGRLGIDEVWRAANVDEDWNIERWGADDEVTDRRAYRLRDLRTAASVLDALRPGPA